MSFMRRKDLRFALPTAIVISLVAFAIARSPNPVISGFFLTLALLALEAWLLLRDHSKRALYLFLAFSGGGILLSLFSAVYKDLRLVIVVIGISA